METRRGQIAAKRSRYHRSLILALTPGRVGPDSAYGVFNLSGANCRFSPTARGLIIALYRVETSGEIASPPWPIRARSRSHDDSATG